MSIIRKEPFRDLLSLREAMDRLLEDSFIRPRLAPLLGGVPSFPIDMYETADAVVVEAPIAGLKPEDIDITIVGDTLTIKAEVRPDREASEESFFISERRFGVLTRTVSLPISVNPDVSRASYDNGVLKLTMPKSESAKTKQIKVRTAP